MKILLKKVTLYMLRVLYIHCVSDRPYVYLHVQMAVITKKKAICDPPMHNNY